MDDRLKKPEKTSNDIDVVAGDRASAEMGNDEQRTHGPDSAIDDDIST
jgi:hypothetical protein